MSFDPNEVRLALQSGECIGVRLSNEESCRNFSPDGVKIFYDKKGNAIDYAFPHYDPKVDLNFTVSAGLVPYGTGLQSLMAGTGHVADGAGEWEEVEQGFNDLVYAVMKMSRSLLPPEPISVDHRDYEVLCVCRCDNLACSANSGPVDLKPLPFLPESK